MPLSRRARLLAELRARLNQAESERDRAAVLSDDTLSLADRLLDTVADPDSDPEVLYVLGGLHWLRYLALPEGQDQADLTAALRFFRPLYHSHPEAVPDQVRQYFENTAPQDAGLAALAERGREFLERALGTQDADVLDAAISLLERAVAATPADLPSRAGRLSNLGAALLTRYQRSGTLEDLDRGIEVIEQAVAATPAGHPNRAPYLSNLGAALSTRYQRSDTLEDLDRAIEVIEQAVAAAAGDPDRGAHLSNLGAALLWRYQRSDTLEDLDRAIEVVEQAVSAGHTDRARYLSNLGNALARVSWIS